MFQKLVVNVVKSCDFAVCRELMQTSVLKSKRFSSFLPQPCRSLSLFAKPQHNQFSVASNSAISRRTVLSNCHTCQPWLNGQIVRGMPSRNNYRPNAYRRIKKHGIHKRIETEGGLAVLWRRFLKGRHNLAVYEDFRPMLKEFHRPKPKVKT